MAELVQFEFKRLPELWLIGKQIRYSMDAHMKGDNRMPALWEQCFSEGAFAPLEAQAELVYDDAYVGAMLDWARGDGDFSYVVGLLMKPGAQVPEGYAKHVLAATEVGVSWVRGADAGDVCSAAHEMTQREIEARGAQCADMAWCMELYNCPRFTSPDAEGKIILDYYIPCRRAEV